MKNLSSNFQPSKDKGRNFVNPRVICQVCGKVGHVALKCYHRFDITFLGNNWNQEFVGQIGNEPYKAQYLFG